MIEPSPIGQDSNVCGCNCRQTWHSSRVIHAAINTRKDIERSPDFSGVSSLLVEAGGQRFHLFRDGLDYAFILHRFRDVPDAGRVIRASLDADPSAGSSVKADQPVYESLQGRAKLASSHPSALPGRCRQRLEGSPNEPRFHFTLPGKGDHCVPSHQSNPRPQALHFRLYVRSCLFGFSPHATRAAGKTLGQLTVSLNAAPRSTVQRDPVSASPGFRGTGTSGSEVRRD